MAFVSPAATGTGWIRLGHLSPDTPPVDVCVYSSRNSSARIRLPEVEYGDISPYETLGAGDYSIAIRAAEASASGQPVMSTSVTVTAGHAYTVAVMGPAVRIIQASVRQQTGREVTCATGR